MPELEFNNLRSYRAAVGCACVSCGAHGEQVWLDSASGRCVECRMGHKKTIVNAPVDDAEGLVSMVAPGAEVKSRAAELATTYQDEMLAMFTELDVVDDESMALAAEGVQEVKRLRGELEAERRKGTDPLNKVIQTIRGWFRPAEEALGQCETLLKGKMQDYLDAVRELNAEKVAETAAAAQAGDMRAATAALAEIVTPGKTEGVSVAKRWVFRATNLGMVPAEYLLLNEKAVREAMQAAVKRGEVPGETFLIPGVLFEQAESIRIRG